MKKGKVWLVGAGPSDVGLLTVKAKELIAEADVVVYDRLIGPSIMMLIPDTAERINVGKQSGHHLVKQDRINEILLEKALEGKHVVRLKGGDPFVFGRGGEELELLVKHNIPFEIVPGVTSAISVPAYNGIPVTHRDCTSSVHIITGHKREGVKLDIKFRALVDTEGTLVFLMGVNNLPEICQGLLEAGMDPSMPAAILQQGTSANQKKIIATVSTLEEEVRRRGVETPAIIIVGKVCAYSEEFAWFEKLPLFGAKIVVTRPRERISTVSEKLRKLGAQVVEIPAIRTVPIADNTPLTDAIEHLKDYQYLVFTSPAGVNYFFDALGRARKDIRSFGTGKIAVIGQGTAKELKKYGLIADLVPEVFDAAHLGALIGETCSDADHILIPRARIGSQELIQEIAARSSARITDLPIYDTVYETQDIVDEKEEFEKKTDTMAVFTSASTVHGFAQTTSGLDYSKVTALCIGKQTKQAADALGMKTYMAKKATIDALVDLAVSVYPQIKNKGE